MKNLAITRLLKKKFFQILPSFLLLSFAPLYSQQLDVQGETTGRDTVAKIRVNTPEEGVIGLHVYSAKGKAIDAYSEGWPAVYGESVSGVGLHGKSTNWRGVYGYSENSRGVYGESKNFRGVYGKSTHGYGVYGTSDNSYAGYFDGDAKVVDTLEVGAFKTSYYEIVDHNSNIETSLDMGAHAYCALAYFKIRGATGTNRYAKVELNSGIWYLKVRAESPALEVSAGCYCID